MDLMNDTIHKFTLAGLGQAPFKFTGMEEKTYNPCPGAMMVVALQPGGTCAYCGTTIRYCYGIVSADGIRSVVGSECINKAGDEGLKKKVALVERDMAADKRAAKANASLGALDAILADEEACAWLAWLPHPTPTFAAEGVCLGEYVSWMALHCGAAGRGRLLKFLRSA